MRNETLLFSSRSSRSRTWRRVTALPSCPAKGPVFTRKNMDTVGSSISRGTRAAWGKSGAAKVSPMPISWGPAIHTMSPAWASSTAVRSSPRVAQRWATFSVRVEVTSQMVCPSSVQWVAMREKGSPREIFPERILPQPMRPM